MMPISSIGFPLSEMHINIDNMHELFIKFLPFCIIGLLLPLVNAIFVVNNVVANDCHLHVIFVACFQAIVSMAMSLYHSLGWFCLGKRRIDLPNRGEYMLPKGHLEVHTEDKGAFPREVIPSSTLASLGMQHTSNPHDFEVWPKEGGLGRQ